MSLTPEELLKKAVTQDKLTRDTVNAQFCSDWLKDQILSLFDRIEELERSRDHWRTLEMKASASLESRDQAIEVLMVALGRLIDSSECTKGTLICYAHGGPHPCANQLAKDALAQAEKLLGGES